jgi:phospho-N-acetylmuramoyl-pentapeptide-transferase
MYFNLIKIFLPTAVAFFFGIFMTPVATHFFYKYKMWKRYARSKSTTVTEFSQIHNEEEELHTPRVGGIIVWFSVVVCTLLFYIISIFFSDDAALKLNFLSRNQTLIPLFALLAGSMLGLLDDFLQIYGSGSIAQDDKAWRKWKVFLIIFVSLLIGLWFFVKLGMTGIHIPFYGEYYLGWLIIPFFIFVSVATFSGGVIDGIDGLAGGVLAAIFAAYAAIAYANNQVDIATFSGVITGAILAFLWFNIPPARFYMGETGMMGLTITLATISFLTDSVLILPIVAMPLVITSLSVVIQIFSKKLRDGKRVFRLAPLHHHFEAIGWSRSKITMRYWVFGIIFAIIGIVLFIISK